MFESIIGQDRTKRALQFYLESQNQDGILLPLLLVAPRGAGKTKMSTEFCRQLKNLNGRTKRPAVKVNGSSCKDLDKFVEGLSSYIAKYENQFCLFVDEVHDCSREIITWLLSVLEPSEGLVNTVYHEDQQFTFDFCRFNFIAATTNPEKLPDPFKNRFNRIELEDYTSDQLAQMLKKFLPNIKFKSEVEKDIVSVCRESPRVVFMLSNDIVNYCKKKDDDKFTKKDWSALKWILGLQPLGLKSKEIKILHCLDQCGASSLTNLAAQATLDTQTLRREIETFLLSQGLIKIEGKRHITNKGRQVLYQCDIRG